MTKPILFTILALSLTTAALAYTFKSPPNVQSDNTKTSISFLHKRVLTPDASSGARGKKQNIRAHQSVRNKNSSQCTNKPPYLSKDTIPNKPAPKSTFHTIDLHITTPDPLPLAAYQIDFKLTTPNAKFSGFIQGESQFNQPPKYDLAALKGEHVILASFTLNEKRKLKKGRIRIASISVMLESSPATQNPIPAFQSKLIVAASSDGKKIPNAKLQTSLRKIK